MTAYYERLTAEAPPEAHVLKLADRTDNLRSIQALVMRTGDRHRRWAGRYLDADAAQVVPLTATAPSIARVDPGDGDGRPGPARRRGNRVLIVGQSRSLHTGERDTPVTSHERKER